MAGSYEAYFSMGAMGWGEAWAVGVEEAKGKSMGASPHAPANGGQSLPQWITPCYNAVWV